MSILIEVNTATMSVSEAHALAGFLDALYPGRAAPTLIPAVAVPPVAAPAAAPASPQALADALMSAESARVAQAAPAPVPAPPAPSAAPAAAPAAGAEELHYPIKLPNGTEIDAEGLPWDKRIHSENKGLLKSGVWKLRRNVDAAVVQHVKNELRHAMAAPPAIPVATNPAPAPAPAIQVEGGTVGTVTAAPAPVPAPPAPAVQVEGAAPPAPAAGDFSAATFADLMSRVVDLSMAGVTPEVINGLCAQVGLAQPRDANHRPDLIPQLMGLLATLG